MRKAEFKWSALSEKQQKVFAWWSSPKFKDYNGIICDGAIRSGKTVSMELSFCLWAMFTFDGMNFALCGKTIGSLKRNVVVTLKKQLIAERYTVIEHKSDNTLVVSKNGRSNIFYMFGGKDESSQALIQGLTLAGVFFDEVALMPKSFVEQATARCSVDGSKFWFNCNPEGPDHWFYVEWILQCRERKLVYLHFRMEDNLTLTKAIIERYKAMYSGVFFDRFIKGLWVIAQGVIFRFFAENTEKYLIDDSDVFDEEGKCKLKFSHLVMGIDFGGNGSKTTMVLNGYMNGFKNFVILEECGLPLTDDVDAEAICKAFAEFETKCRETYRAVDWIFPDSASTTLINSLISTSRKNRLSGKISGCRKNEVADRPITMDLLLNTGRLKISKRCPNVIRSISNLRWDEKKPNIPEDKNLGNINDWWDALMYTMLDFIEFIDLER